MDTSKDITKDEYWKNKLTEEEYRVMRKHGTEAPFSNEFNAYKKDDYFVCKACKQKLFKAGTKFDSGTGWPSFYDFIPGSVETSTDFKLLYPRTEVHCSNCKSHLGHVFRDGPTPTGLRYCINGISLDLK